MEKGIMICFFLFLSLFDLQSQDFEVSFNGGEAVIDSLIATNLSSGESIKLPGDATLILRESANTIHTIQDGRNQITITYPPDAGYVFLHFPSMSERKISIQLSEISGRVLVKKDFVAHEGINQYTVSARQHGVYIVSIFDGNDLYSAKAVLSGENNNNLSYSAIMKTGQAHILKSASDDPYVLIYSPGDVISYEFYSGLSMTIIHEEPGTSTVLSPEFHACVDFEANSYSIVEIGNQWWMAENLRSTSYADGSEIPLVEFDYMWNVLASLGRACCFYNNDQSIAYGALYNYAAAVEGTPYDGSVQVQGVCPNGWHIPGNEEWTELKDYLILHAYNWDGTRAGNKIAKSLASTSGWIHADFDGTVGRMQTDNNSTGFNGIPAGYRGNETGVFLHEGISGNWWSSNEHSASEAFRWFLERDSESLTHLGSNNKAIAYSVRCIKDADAGPAIYNFTADRTELPLGEAVTFTDLSSGAEYSIWNFGDCRTSMERNPTHIYSAPGIYSVSLGSAVSNRINKKDYILVTESEKRILSDSEDNSYESIKIGNQLWMAENLESTMYADGTPIPLITDNTEWGSLPADNTSRAYCFYDNNESRGYGALYTYAAAVNRTPYDGSGDVQGICPDAWHIPAETEWDELENHLIDNGYNYDGSTNGNRFSKSLASTSGWSISTNEGAIGNEQSTNNSSGFDGLPGGFRSYFSTLGEFSKADSGGYWWMANDSFDEMAFFWNLYFDYKHALRDYTFKRTGLSVRCLKDDDGSPLAGFMADVTEVKLGEVVNFTDLSTNGPTRWIWSFGEGFETSTEQNPSHHFTREGIHRVVLIAFNENGFDIETKEGYITVSQAPPGYVNDLEGNIYSTVEIGDQWWMAENLKATKYNDGSNIPLSTDSWDLSTPAYGWYENDEASYGDTYGALYNWYTVNTGKLCPSGWHVPTDDDWKVLEIALGMPISEVDTIYNRSTYVGSKLAGNADLWTGSEINYDSIDANPHFGTSGFMALPGGVASTFGYRSIEETGLWWSSTELESNFAIQRVLPNNSGSVTRSHQHKIRGCSVRCLKD